MLNHKKIKHSLVSELEIIRNEQLNYNDSIYFLGSCFSVEMAKRFSDSWINTHANPFGTIYSPMALMEILGMIESGEPNEFFEYNHEFHAMQFDASWKSSSSEELVTRVKKTLIESKEQLSVSQHVWITLGSAWVYSISETGEWVGNCHKIPQKSFQKSCLTHQQVSHAIHQIIEIIKRLNPKTNIGFTVSPVRHIRDGLTENTRSKSILISALSEVISENRGVFYFPAYEIMTEELKDYRFYNHDLMHPSEWSIDYIFQRFIETYGTELFFEYMDNAGNLRKLMTHKLKNSDPKEIESWNTILASKMSEFSGKYPEKKISIPQLKK